VQAMLAISGRGGAPGGRAFHGRIHPSPAVVPVAVEAVHELVAQGGEALQVALVARREHTRGAPSAAGSERCEQPRMLKKFLRPESDSQTACGSSTRFHTTATPPSLESPGEVAHADSKMNTDERKIRVMRSACARRRDPRRTSRRPCGRSAGRCRGTSRRRGRACRTGWRAPRSPPSWRRWCR